MYTIYVLKDPRTDTVHYVGATQLSLSTRLEYHIADTYYKEKQSPRVRWLRELADVELEPHIIELETSHTRSSREAGDLEQGWIEYFKARGCKLLNVRRGGGGLRQQGSSSYKGNFSRWALDNLGKVPDTRVARHEDKSPATIRYWRLKWGIPRYRGSRYPPNPFADPSVPAPVQIWNSIQIIKENLREYGILTEHIWQYWEAMLVDWKEFYEGYGDQEGIQLAQMCGVFLLKLLEDKERLRDEIVSLKG